MTPWKSRVVGNKCARSGCPVILPPDAEHCLCDEHAEEHRGRNARSARQTRQYRRVQLVLWRDEVSKMVLIDSEEYARLKAVYAAAVEYESMDAGGTSEECRDAYSVLVTVVRKAVGRKELTADEWTNFRREYEL